MISLKIGINSIDETVLKEINKIETDKFKIRLNDKTENLGAESQIIENFLIGLSANVAWDMLKTLFNVLYTHNIQMKPIDTELNKIGSIYFEEGTTDITVIIKNDDSVQISNKTSVTSIM